MKLREAAQQALEALEVWRDSLTNPSAIPGWRFAVVGEKAVANLRAALSEDVPEIRFGNMTQGVDLPPLPSPDYYDPYDEETPFFSEEQMRAYAAAIIAALRAALAEDRVADTGKTYDDTDDTPEQKMLRKKWFGGRLYGHLPFLEAVDETMKRLYDKLDEAKGTWKMLDNHFPDAGKMVATIRPEVTVDPVATISKTETVEPVAWIGCLEGGIEYGTYHKAALKLPDGVRFDLYTAPPKRKPLTDDDIEALRQGEQRLNFVTLREFRVIARAIERAHGIGGEE